MQLLGQVEEQLEVLLRSHAVAAGHNDGRALEIVLRLLHVSLDDLHHAILVGDVVARVVTDDFAAIVRVAHLLLHHALAYGGHLWPVVGVDDGGDDVAAECGADLVEQILVGAAGFAVFVRADLQGRTVGGESAGEGRRDAWPKVATDDGGAHQGDLRLFFLEELDEHGRVGQ